jgi:hypothetical protein
MSQVVFAMFENRSVWEKARQELKLEGLINSENKFVVRDSQTDDDELSFEESDLGNGMSRGFFLGIAFGFAIGFFGSWVVGYNMFGPWEYGMLASLGFGLFGALGGGLTGSILPNARLKQMLDNLTEEQVVVSTKVSNESHEIILEDKLRKLGAIQVAHSFSLA